MRNKNIKTISDYVKKAQAAAFYEVKGMGTINPTFVWEEDGVHIFIEDEKDIDMSDDFWDNLDDIDTNEVGWDYFDDEQLADIVSIIKES